jgi:hypothetical protein
MLPSLCFRHGSPPLSICGNEPGVQKGKIFQSGSSQHQHQPLLRVTNAMAHGPGIKLLNGLVDQAPLGLRSILTVAASTFSATCGTSWGRDNLKVPSCYGAGQPAKLGILLKRFARRGKN